MRGEKGARGRGAKGTSRREFLVTAGAGIASLTMATRVGAQGAPRRVLKIGIIGSGRQGGAVGLQWAKAGHEIMFSSRNPGSLSDLVTKAGAKAKAGTPQEAAAFGDVILIAVPYGALPQVGKDYGAAMKGKIVIDCGNPRADRDGPMATDAIAKGTGVASAAYLPGVRLVRAFNALSFVQVDREAHRAGEKLAIPVAGDDQAAVATVVQLVQDAGFEPVVVGGLARAKEFDTGTSVYVKGMTAKQIRTELKLPPQ
jgi:predicted dinucleotide-binding enzyme